MVPPVYPNSCRKFSSGYSIYLRAALRSSAGSLSNHPVHNLVIQYVLERFMKH